MKKLLALVVLMMVAGVAVATTPASYDDVDTPNVVEVELSRGTGTLINWRVNVCVTTASSGRVPECNTSNGVLTQGQSNTITTTIKSVMLAKYCTDHNLTCAP